MYIWDVWSETVWKYQKLGRSYIGNEKTIASFTKEDVRKYLDEFYIPQNIVFVVSGNVETKKVESVFNRHLLSENKHNIVLCPIIQHKQIRNIKIYKNNLDNLTIALGFQTVSLNNKDAYVLEFISELLGGGFSSRLRQKVMEPGYTYSIDANIENFFDNGYFMIQFTTTKDKLPKVINIILNEFKDLKVNFVSEKEIELVKGYYSGFLKVNTETSYDWAKWYGNQYILGKENILSLDDKIKIISDISSNHIKNVANKYFIAEHFCMVILGDLEESNLYIPNF